MDESSSPQTISTKWRESPALNSKYLSELKAKIETFSLNPDLNVKQAKILLLGPTNTGKSSFVNTIASIFQEAIVQATTSSSGYVSPSRKFRQFLFRSLNNERPMNFCMCDTHGIAHGVLEHPMDLTYLVEGNVPIGYTFTGNPISEDDEGFKHNPGFEDTFHCVVFVFDATAVKTTEPRTWEKLNDLQIRMNMKDIPRIVLLTKIDKLSNAIKYDLSQVFFSNEVKTTVGYVSQRLGIPTRSIMAIKNYESEIVLEDKTSCLALQALYQMLSYAKHFLVTHNDHMQHLRA